MSNRDEHPLHPNLVEALDEAGHDAAALDAIARRLSELGPDASLPAPPPGLFAAIEAELAGDGAPVRPEVVPLAARRSRRRLLLALGAAAAIVVVVASVAVLREEDRSPTTEEVVLEPLPGFEGATGSATVVIDGDVRTVGVDLSEIEVPPGSHLELWLLDEPVEELVPLGPLSSGAPHAIPADVDLDTTPIVDVSLEPDDGNPAHSGVSVVRGQLQPS